MKCFSTAANLSRPLGIFNIFFLLAAHLVGYLDKFHSPKEVSGAAEDAKERKLKREQFPPT